MVELEGKTIDEKITELELERDAVVGKECEVYARIVGYYRSVKNWNIGKKAEYKKRKVFEVTDGKRDPNKKHAILKNRDGGTQILGKDVPEEIVEVGTPNYSLLLVRPTCPKCPIFKNIAKTMKLPYKIINAEETDGFTLAQKYGVTSVPTLLVFDESENIVESITDAEVFKKFAKDSNNNLS